MDPPADLTTNVEIAGGRAHATARATPATAILTGIRAAATASQRGAPSTRARPAQRPRAFRPRSRRARARSPGGREDDEPAPPERLTPLQLALRAFAAALEHAHHDQQTHDVFLDVAACRIAAEYARQQEAA